MIKGLRKINGGTDVEVIDENNQVFSIKLLKYIEKDYKPPHHELPLIT